MDSEKSSDWVTSGTYNIISSLCCSFVESVTAFHSSVKLKICLLAVYCTVSEFNFYVYVYIHLVKSELMQDKTKL